jgi:hypothetical protein
VIPYFKKIGKLFPSRSLVGTRGKIRFGLQELALYRGRTVDEIIAKSVSEFLEKSSFNHPGDLKSAIEKIGADPTIVDTYVRILAPMMSRRHWIAHRADRNTHRGPGHQAVNSLSKVMFARWVTIVETFGLELLAKL